MFYNLVSRVGEFLNTINIFTKSETDKSSTTITLFGKDSVNVPNVLPGSYIIAVRPLVNGGPTACFALSKSSSDLEACITRLTTCKGSNNEHLELSWKSNSDLSLRKTGLGYDGEYLVDFNSKSF